MPGFTIWITIGCLMIMEIWAIYPLLELPYLAWISHFSAPLIYSSRRLEKPKENWLHNSIWKTLVQEYQYVILWIQKWRSWRKIYTCAPERFVIRERKREKKGFWSLRLMEIWAMYPLLFGLNFTLLHTTGYQERMRSRKCSTIRRVSWWEKNPKGKHQTIR